jgi:hypothetical protein
VAPGKSHDLPDSRPVIPAIAMDNAFFAGRFRLQRAVVPLSLGMFRNCRTLQAKEGILAGYILNISIHLILTCMVCPAIYPDEVDQDFQILFLCAGELFHDCIISEKIKGMNDAGQKN